MNINVPVSWLKDYLKTDVTAKTLANSLTSSGPSVDKIIKRGEEYILDVEVTTNRADAYSVFGIAREANAILSTQEYKSNLIQPKGIDINLEPDTSKILPLDVIIKNKNLCPRFTAIVVDNVKIQSSPAYIRNRLEASGIRSINNIVDISNYIMLELGQPMHTFDYDKIKGSKMALRKSGKGESIKTLDSSFHNIPENSIVIEDSQKLIDLCGIMGGSNSAVSRNTKRVVLFVQAYNPILIRKTTQSLAFRTEASSRFEKGVDLEGILPALKKAVYLAKKTAGAQIASELIDIYPARQKVKTIRLNVTKLNSYLGINFETSKAVQILKVLGFEVQLNPNQITAKIPSWRSQDVEDDVDLIEEIARIYGYHNLSSKLPAGAPPIAEDGEYSKVFEIKNALKYLGLTEAITYSVISRELLNISGKNVKSSVELSNPLTEQWQFMRLTIIPSLLDVLAKNQNIENDLKIYEIAKTYIPQKNDLPKQDLMLSFCFNNSNFKEAKGTVENISEILKREIEFSKLNKNHPLFDQNQSAVLKIGDELIGIVGQIKNDAAAKFDLNSIVFAAEINLAIIYKIPPSHSTYKPIAKYPPVIEDLSVIVAQVLPLNEIIDEIKKVDSVLLKSVAVIDIFEDPRFGENKKSITLRLTFQKTTGTPTLSEANRIKQKIIAQLEKSFRARIRN